MLFRSPEYAKYFGRALRLLNSMYGMTNSGSYLLTIFQNGYLRQVLFNHNVGCLSIISMHQMDQKLLSYIMLGIVSIGIRMKILENGLLIPWGRDSM